MIPLFAMFSNKLCTVFVYRKRAPSSGTYSGGPNRFYKQPSKLATFRHVLGVGESGQEEYVESYPAAEV